VYLVDSSDWRVTESRPAIPHFFRFAEFWGSARFCGIIPTDPRPADVFKSYSRMRDPANTILPVTSFQKIILTSIIPVVVILSIKISCCWHIGVGSYSVESVEKTGKKFKLCLTLLNMIHQHINN